MSEQSELIQAYKRKFPEETYKQTANKLNVQVTRVFRIFNGYEMRLSEYHKIRNLVGLSEFESTSQDDKLKSKLWQLLKRMGPYDLKILEKQIDQHNFSYFELAGGAYES